MKMTATLSSYLAKRYSMNLVVLLLALLSIIYLFDTVELIRRASKHDDIPITLVLQMSLLKLPEVGQVLFPFAILFSAMFTFWQLTRRYELIVVRASGFSVWQFLTPIILIGIVFGLLQMTVINPLGAVLIGKFEHLERVYLKRQESQIAVFKEGLWLKQTVLLEQTSEEASTITEQSQGYIILHAKSVSPQDWTLKAVTILYFTESDSFIQRVDAKKAQLDADHWLLENATIHPTVGEAIHLSQLSVPTSLTISDIEESFSSPESMSFWKLPDYIKTLEETGFDASRLKVHYHGLLSRPLMFCAMILLAASVSMKPPRSRGAFIMIAAGVFIGFLVFFISSFLQALGASQQIPAVLAAWAPALIAFLLGLSVMMNVEDG